MPSLLRRVTDKVLVEGHRGSEANHAGNTWQSLEEGYLSGADLIEVDIQASRDGVLFLSHHYREPSGRLLRDLTWAELSSPEGSCLPRLDEVLDWCMTRSVMLSLDIKDGLREKGALTSELSALLRRVGGTRPPLIASGWNHEMLRRFKSMHPDILTRALVRGRLVDPVHTVKLARAHALTISYDLLRFEDVDALHRSGIAVTLTDLWEPNYEFVYQSGVDIVTVGDPALARRELDRLGATSAG